MGRSATKDGTARPDADDPEVIEVEVERLPLEDEAPPRGGFGADWATRLAGGLTLDALDFLTPNGLPKPLVLAVGGYAGWWIGGRLGLDLRGRVLLAAAGAAYCALPGTQRLPIGTLVAVLSGLGVRFGA